MERSTWKQRFGVKCAMPYKQNVNGKNAWLKMYGIQEFKMKEHPILQTWRNVEFALTSFIFSFVFHWCDAARSTINDDDFFRLTLIGLDRPPSFTRSVKLLPFLLGPSMTDWQRGPHFGPSPTTFFLSCCFSIFTRLHHQGMCVSLCCCCCCRESLGQIDR